MISPKRFVECLSAHGVDFYTGVPDSLLKNLLAYIGDTCAPERHITAANEGNAIALAAGYHLATGRLAAVYMQNSGLGNAVNPLASLADRDVYSIPLLLIVGWRGEPGVSDEPQHAKQGRVTESLLNTLELPFEVLTPDMSESAMASMVGKVIEAAQKEKRPAALLVRKGSFEAYRRGEKEKEELLLSREAAIEAIVAQCPPDDIIVSSTGKISRELYEIRKKHKEATGRDFLTVGSMGHASQIALGVALEKPNRNVWCLDGDGAAIMHLGGLATIGWIAPRNFKHIILNNLAHESVGGQPSAAQVIDFPAIAQGCRYAYTASVGEPGQLRTALAVLAATPGPAFLEIRTNKNSRKDLARPEETPEENKRLFMNFVEHGAN